MSLKLLLMAVVRESAKLLAAIATHNDTRLSIAHLDVHLFGGLADALQHAGVSRKVSADMLGMVPRAFLRKYQRAKASATDRGRSLWEAVYDYISQEGEVSVLQVQQRFSRDDGETLNGVLADLRESGVVVVQGRGKDARYRGASHNEVTARLQRGDNSTDLVWTLIHHGPVSRAELLTRGVRETELDQALSELVADERVETLEVHGDTHYRSARYSIPAGSPIEGAILDHLHAVVSTLATVLRRPHEPAAVSTYQLDVWPEHPMWAEARQLFRDTRDRASALRTRIDEYNVSLPERPQDKLNLYIGISREGRADPDGVGPVSER